MNKSILKLAVPNIISNITIPLLGLVDMALMGHLGDEKYIGAIALGGVIFNIIYWSFAFLRMGTSGFTAQAFGERNNEKAITVLVRALLVAAIAASFILLLQRPIEWLSFLLIGGSDAVETSCLLIISGFIPTRLINTPRLALNYSKQLLAVSRYSIYKVAKEWFCLIK